jgi:hypothetical protein
MEPDPGDEAPHRRRLAPAWVRPLEIWDLLTRAGPLHSCRRRPDYPQLISEALEAIRAGEARRPGGECVRAAFGAVAVTGGGLLEPGVREALADRFPGPLTFAPDPVFAAALGRFGDAALVADVGQTAIKVVHAGGRFLYPRDWGVLPPAEDIRPEDVARQRAALRSFVAAALRPHHVARRGTVVLALPCDFPGGVPGACSYAGLGGDADFVEAVLAGAGLAACDCVYLNDAVLAALSVARRAVPTLVVTLGFGVGGALIEGGRDAL